jgi:predicted nucleotide-binding protein
MYKEIILMAPRRPPTPEPPVLTIDQKRRRVERLRECVGKLEAFEPQKVQKRYGIPEVMALEASIKQALADAFGEGTPAFNRFKRAASLDNGPHQMRMGDAFGRGPHIDYDALDAEEARQYLADGKDQSIALLQTAIESIEHEIAEQEALSNSAPASSHIASNTFDRSKVFIVHGHDGAPKSETARFIEKLGFEAIILHERPNKGRTLITKFREEADGVGFAVVLMTPDDLGKAVSSPEQGKLRARQNVVFELGFFIGKLGPERVAALVKGDIEPPSDFDGVAYISLDKEEWQRRLAAELKEAGYRIDWNKVMDQ